MSGKTKGTVSGGIDRWMEGRTPGVMAYLLAVARDQAARMGSVMVVDDVGQRVEVTAVDGEMTANVDLEGLLDGGSRPSFAPLQLRQLAAAATAVAELLERRAEEGRNDG